MEGTPTSGGGGIDVEQLADTVAELQQRVDDLERENEQLREENASLRERVDDLENQPTLEWDSNELADLWVVNGQGTRMPVGNIIDSSISETRFETKLEDLEDRLADGDLSDASDQEDATVETETPLEDVVALPEQIAEEKLSPNQQRARFVASDVPSYGDRTQAGWSLSTSEVRRVLRAGTDCDGHDETIRRVMTFVDELGKDGTKLRKKNGERKVFVDERTAKRLQQLGSLETHVSVSRAEA